MLEYNKINEKIIDTHMHLEAWENEEFSDFTKCFDKYTEITDARAINICSVPSILLALFIGFILILEHE